MRISLAENVRGQRHRVASFAAAGLLAILLAC
jgi:hypothetical protein